MSNTDQTTIPRPGLAGYVDRALIFIGVVAAPALTLLVDQHAIGITTSVDIAAIVSAVAAGWHGQTAVKAVQARKG